MPALLRILDKISDEASAYDEQQNHVLCEEVCWAIGNIAGDSDDYRVLLLESGTLKPMVNFMLYALNRLQLASVNSTQSEGMGIDVAGLSPLSSSGSNLDIYQSRAQTAVWALSNMARGVVPGAIFLESGEHTIYFWCGYWWYRCFWRCMDFCWAIHFDHMTSKYQWS